MAPLVPRLATFAALTLPSLAFAEGSLMAEQLGKLHYVVLHFPVVLVTLLPVVVIVSLLPFGKIWRPAIPAFLYLGTLSAIAASFLGFFELSQRETVSRTLSLHQYGAYTLTAYMAIFSLIFFLKKPKLEERVPTALVVASVVAGALITGAAHFGGESVHGTLFMFLGGE